MTSSGRHRLKLLGGIVGPAAFTAAWVFATLRQHGVGGYSVAAEHISGLAAADARHPRLMTAAFVALGGGTALFGSAREDSLGGRGAAGAGPRLIRDAGVALVAVAVLRRDRMLLGLPEGAAGPSWRNRGHDLASGLVYAGLVAAPLALARRFRDDPEWAALRRPAIASSAATATALAVFAARVVEPWNGVVQRIAVTIPAGVTAALAAEVLRRPGPAQAVGPSALC